MAFGNLLGQMNILYNIEYFIPNQNIHSFQVQMEYCNMIDTWWNTKRVNKLKKTEIISRIFFNHNTMRLKINYKKKNIESNQYVTKQLNWNHKILEENISSKLFDIGLDNILLEMSPQVRGTQAKFFKWDYSSQGKNIVFYFFNFVSI